MNEDFGNVRAALAQSPSLEAFREACDALERAWRAAPEATLEELLPYVLDQTRAWPLEAKLAPLRWAGLFVDDVLPYALLRPVAGLSLMGVHLDESCRPLTYDRQNERLKKLRAWLGQMPRDDEGLSVQYLDWSLPKGLYLDSTQLYFYEWKEADLNLLFHSPLCAALERLNLSRGDWEDHSIGDHDAYNRAGEQMSNYMSGLTFEDLIDVPFAGTLEALAMAGTCDYIQAWVEGEEGVKFERLTFLDLGLGTRRPNKALRALADRGWAPNLEELHLATGNLQEFSLRMIADPETFRERYVDDEDSWFGHDYCDYDVDGLASRLIEPATLYTFYEGVGMKSLRTLVVGKEVAHLQEMDEYYEDLERPERLEIVATKVPTFDLQFPA